MRDIDSEEKIKKELVGENERKRKSVKRGIFDRK
jgi:hypothetical protein